MGTEGWNLVRRNINGRTLEWNMLHSEFRGKQVLEMMLRMELAVLNTGFTSTFRDLDCVGFPGVMGAGVSISY